MKIIRKASEMQRIALKLFKAGEEIGIVPTMGALHEGHISLINKSVKQDDITIVSIFINPIQFGSDEDFLKYPRLFNRDISICRKNHVDYVFAPSAEDMFAKDHKTFIDVRDIQDILCGEFRKGHFIGVATVVAKLFNIAFAERAYFGMKDFQQLRIIDKMAKDLNFRTKIVPCPIVREKSGLAMSSRNLYLNEREKKIAAEISKILKEAKAGFKNKSAKKIIAKVKSSLSLLPESKVDYAEMRDYESLSVLNTNTKKAVLAVAVWIGKTRLIDNIMLSK
ncbi:MAG: pantoate--beta-alanine ligase [Endomicrobium sp.]|jgi:pantoate--beta-alanine ligase|nr:pantoate--beta-alanine ligase [Endomicrobium sp.]